MKIERVIDQGDTMIHDMCWSTFMEDLWYVEVHIDVGLPPREPLEIEPEIWAEFWEEGEEPFRFPNHCCIAHGIMGNGDIEYAQHFYLW